MAYQIFKAPVGQVAAGSINNHVSRWTPHSLPELMNFERQYKRDRRKAFLSQYFNKAAALLLVTSVPLGWWGGHMIQTSGLNGVIAPEIWAVIAAFVAALAGASFWLSVIRTEAKETISVLDKELIDIRREMQFKKSKR